MGGGQETPEGSTWLGGVVSSPDGKRCTCWDWPEGEKGGLVAEGRILGSWGQAGGLGGGALFWGLFSPHRPVTLGKSRPLSGLRLYEMKSLRRVFCLPFCKLFETGAAGLLVS